MNQRDTHVSGRNAPQAGTLYVVATPIGNLDDLGGRAADILACADIVLVEDTRHSAKLLSHYGINRATQALHEHNESGRVESIVQSLLRGASVALISDAGTPLINDPGFVLVAAAHEAGLPVRAVPGPSALSAALSVAGMPVDRFCFEGFAPPRKAARQRALAALRTEPRTMVFFEAPHRVRAFAADAVAVFGAERKAAVVREISKVYENVWRGALGQLQDWLLRDEIRRGEFVMLLAGAPRTRVDTQEAERIMRIVSARLAPRMAAAVTAEITGWGSRDLYRLVRPGAGG